MLGLALAGLLFLAPWVGPPGTFVKDYQTLIGALLSLGAAGATVWMIYKQIRSGEVARRKQQLDRLRAARAVLPFALTEIIQYARTSIDLLLPLLPKNDDRNAEPLPASGPINPPPLPDVLSTIKDCIEASDPEPADGLGKILEFLQIHHARLTDLCAKLNGRRPAGCVVAIDSYDIRSRVVDSLVLHSHTSDAFDFSRRRSNHIDYPPTLKTLSNSARICDVDDRYPTVTQLIEERAKTLEKEAGYDPTRASRSDAG